MFLSPKWIALFTALLVSMVTVAFLSFLPEIDANIMFVVGVCSFITALIITYYLVDVMIFSEINLLYKFIKKIKDKDLDISHKNLVRSGNPLQMLNSEISNYVYKKQDEIEELKRMEVFRREFIADVSHELKTPIFAAQGFIHTLIDGALYEPDVAARFLNKAAKSIDGLDVLVKDLVILTQVESGDLKMNFSKVNLEEITKDIFEQLESKASKRNVKLKLIIADPNAIFVWADKQRLTQVFINLIENAIKYGKESGIVTIELRDEFRNVGISITDDGPGIESSHLSRIFERFYRVDKSRSRETGGTGLGLAIVKHILNAHDTNISVISKLGKGTRFNFHLAKSSTKK